MRLDAQILPMQPLVLLGKPDVVVDYAPVDGGGQDLLSCLHGSSSLPLQTFLNFLLKGFLKSMLTEQQNDKITENKKKQDSIIDGLLSFLCSEELLALGNVLVLTQHDLLPFLADECGCTITSTSSVMFLRFSYRKHALSL